MRTLIQNRELLIRLALKDLRVRYRRPFLGILWSFLIPLCTIFIFQIVFSAIMRVPIGEYPFFIYLATAIFPWRFFQASVTKATTCILDNRSLIKDASFPRLLLPVSVVLAELINFLPSLCIMVAFLLFFNTNFSFLLICLPVVVLLHAIFIIGISLITSSLHVRYRDVRYIVEILLVALFYLTPVFYSLDMVVGFFKGFFLNIYLSNPLVGILNLYRVTLLHGFIDTLPEEISLFNTVGLPLFLSFFAFFAGIYVFKKHEALFGDYLAT